jgi:hypothetical protein
MTSFSQRSDEHFRIAAEHANWCWSEGQRPEDVLAAIDVTTFPHEILDWTRVLEELARAHLRLTGGRGAAM